MKNNLKIILAGAGMAMFPAVTWAQDSYYRYGPGGYGPGMHRGMMDYGYYGFGIISAIITIIIWVIIIAAIIYLIRYLIYGGRGRDHLCRYCTDKKSDRYSDILKERYAKGEITKEEMERMKGELGRM
jgi:putative membrane protein